MRSLRLLLALVAAWAVGATSAGALALPAGATTEPVQLSNDGRTWSPDLPRPLFDAEVRWVPGDSRSATFWVRDAGESDGALSVAADVQDTDGLLAEDAMSLRLRRGTGPWVELRPGTRVSLGRLEQGAGERIGVVATYAPSAGNDTEDSVLTFSLDVRLSGEDASGPPGGAPEGEPPDDGGLLPATGSPVRWWLIALASLFIGGGAALVLRSKRSSKRKGSP